ncbi:MAG: hydroxymethylglutaryl-CoA reductase, degradative [Candidatus Diapherotrites archaeon]|uniref:3-hydroxy-3-methylglutaryl coenzyme A reductase n=1 Tax=Candidatus Iainarchaeum sp. TaxID=3101447 RepID=A0A939C9M2_9ARCH|nr:hydroxymethylglutaryl-CoA reductase, degradative [Candidatus Diapherotrites archaeon]
MPSSELHKFYKKGLGERLQIVKEFAGLGEEEIGKLKKYGAMDFETADRMSENVIGTQQLPLGIATNFLINGKDCLIPMAVEEPSIIAAASKIAGLVRKTGGFKAEADNPVMIGQIQLLKVKSFEKAKKAILGKKKQLLEKANAFDPVLVKFGGGAKDIQVREVKSKRGKMLVAHLLVDARDAMGANAVNGMVEAIAQDMAKIASGEQRVFIISNLAIHRKARARLVLKAEDIEGSFHGTCNFVKGNEMVERILDVYALAEADQFRATTHNKGIMNAIDAVAVATGQDWRALESGAHSFAAFKKGYGPLTKYSKDKQGNLVGEIEIPLAVGLVGGAVKTSPVAQAAIKILGVKSAQELAMAMACAGLAENLGSLREIAIRGIRHGHMELHAKNIAIAAGAQGKDIDKVAERIIREGKITVDGAKETLERMHK